MSTWLKPIPGVESQMLDPAYWIAKTKNANQKILNYTEIDQLNRQTSINMKNLGLENQYFVLDNFPNKISCNRLKETMQEYSSADEFPEEKCYDKDGREISEIMKEQIIENAAFTDIEKEIEVEFALLVARTDLRAFPTDIVFARKSESPDIDIFQLTALSCGMEVVVLHKSKDKKWLYIQSKYYPGWVRAENVAIAENRSIIADYLQENPRLLVTGSWLESEPNPFSAKTSNITLQMGDQLPLANKNSRDTVSGSKLQTQGVTGCYPVKIPVRKKNGKLGFAISLLAGQADVKVGQLKYTKHNLLTQAFKMLGERYGWGGMFCRRDCSRFVFDIYRTFGINIPRDAGQPQENGAAGQTIKFTGNSSQRKKIMKQLNPGDPIYMKGHVVIYLGEVDEQHYVIHAGAGYAEKHKGELINRSVHSVFVMNVESFVMRSKERSYLDSFTVARQFK